MSKLGRQVGRAVHAVRTELRRTEPSVGASASVFGPRVRRWSLVWICVTLPVNALIAQVVATSTDRYLVVFAVFASGAYTTPSLVLTYLAARRAPRPDNWCWWIWLVAVVCMYGVGFAMIAGALTGASAGPVANAAAVSVIALLVMTVVVCAVRTRSGRRAVTVDLLDSVMSVIVVAAPSAIIWGDDILSAEAAWYAVPSAIAAVAMVFGVYWAVLLLIRLQGDRAGEGRTAIGIVAVLLAAVGLVNAVAQTVQGVTDFALPAGPMLGLHALCMSLLMLIPVYVPDRITPGLDRLPPQAQVRGGWLPALLIILGLPHLLTLSFVDRVGQPAAPSYALLAVSLVLVLAALRQLAAARETQRLYAEVERAAERRRELLEALMERSDEDRHRVAAELHEQAVSAYASFVSFVQMSAGAGLSDSLAGASASVRDDLRSQAESLRQLMMAVRPLAVDRPAATALATPILAFIDRLYRDGRRPVASVSVGEGVELDWATETLVLRIVQEGVRNVWRHARARHIEVSVQADGAVVEVTIADDGIGFRRDAVLFESGIAAMRSFAGLGDGTVRIDSAPGRGTVVVARLGDVRTPAAPPERAEHPRAVRGDGTADDCEAPGRPRLRLVEAAEPAGRA